MYTPQVIPNGLLRREDPSHHVLIIISCISHSSAWIGEFQHCHNFHPKLADVNVRHEEELLEILIANENICAVQGSKLPFLNDRKKVLKDDADLASSYDVSSSVQEKHSQPPMEFTVLVHHRVTQSSRHGGLMERTEGVLLGSVNISYVSPVSCCNLNVCFLHQS